jgi:hypothetical protein
MRWTFWGFLEFRPDQAAASPLRAHVERGFVPNWPVLRFISQPIAWRWAARLEAGERVEWTPRLWFHPEGLELRVSSFWGATQTTFVPYRNLRLEQVRSVLVFYRSDPRTPLLRESATVDHFFVGLILLERLMQLPCLDPEAIHRHWRASAKKAEVHFLRSPLPEEPTP